MSEGNGDLGGLAAELEAAKPMEGFKDFTQFTAPTRVISGRDLLGSAGFEFTKEGATRAFLVTDQTVRGTGLVDTVSQGLEDGGVEVAGVYDDVPQDSDTRAVEAAATAAKEAGADALMAVGGGSVMDTTKAAAIIFTHGGAAREWEGYYLLPRANEGMGKPEPLVPVACVPTTAGTGSETSWVVVIKDREAQLKFQIADFPLFPRLGILDPASTATLPPQVAAGTGMDALTHAIEGYISGEWTPHTDAYSLEAIRMVRDNLRRAVLTPEDEDARGNMLIAADLAIVPVNCGAGGIAHSMSHPCGARYGTPHGLTNSINLPVVIEFNARHPGVARRLRDVAVLLGVEPQGGSDGDCARAVADWCRALSGDLGLPQRLGEIGVEKEGIPLLADDAMGDGATLVNPVDPTPEDFIGLYEQVI